MNFRHYTDNSCPTYGLQFWKPEGLRHWTFDIYFNKHVFVFWLQRRDY